MMFLIVSRRCVKRWALRLTLIILPRRALPRRSVAKNNLIASNSTTRAGHALGTVIRQVYPAYQSQLAASQCSRFRRSSAPCRHLLRDNPDVRSSLDERYRFILLDEYRILIWRIRHCPGSVD